MEGKNWLEIKNYQCKLENRCNKPFVRWKKPFLKRSKTKPNKKLKDIENKLNEIK